MRISALTESAAVPRKPMVDSLSVTVDPRKAAFEGPQGVPAGTMAAALKQSEPESRLLSHTAPAVPLTFSVQAGANCHDAPAPSERPISLVRIRSFTIPGAVRAPIA